MQLNIFQFTHVHRLTGVRLTIKKIYGNVASCYIETPIAYGEVWGKKQYYDVVVCSLDNLMPI